MKKILLLCTLTLGSVLLFADIGPSNRSTSFDNTGAVRSGSLEKFFIKVKNSHGGALSDGDVVILDVADDDGYSVKATTSASQVPICVLAEDCLDTAVCSCQTYGLKSNVNFDSENGSATAGLRAFISENTAGSIEAEASPAATDVPVGVFYDSSAATGDVELFIKLR